MSTTLKQNESQTTNASKQKQSSHTHFFKPQKSMLNDQEMISLKDSLKDDNFDLSTVEHEKLPKLVSYLKEYESKNVNDENYSEAKFAKIKA